MQLLKGYRGLALGLLTASAALVCVGALHPSRTWSLLLTSVGSAFLGASIASVFGRLGAEELLRYIKSLLNKAFAPKFTSEESAVVQYRRRWYTYNISQKNGAFCWRCIILDFTRSKVADRLATDIQLTDRRGQPHRYYVEAGIRDVRFIVFYHPEKGREPVGMDIVPLMGLEFLGNHSGISIVQAWDGNHSIIPVIFSPGPLYGVNSNGDIPEELSKKFDDEWRKGMRLVGPILPLTTRTEGCVISEPA